MNWGPETYEQSARLWRNRIRKARKMAPSVDHYIEVRFEDLVADTEGVLRRVCEFIELDFDPVMLDYHERAEGRLAEKARELPRKNRPNQPAEARLESHRLAKEPPRSDRIGMWRERMTPEEVAEYEAVAGDMLVELGYELGIPRPAPRAREKSARSRPAAPVPRRGSGPARSARRSSPPGRAASSRPLRALHAASSASSGFADRRDVQVQGRSARPSACRPRPR